jgi:hypothetical protein
MTFPCPSGHASDESDYCSVCGIAIPLGAAAAPPAVSGKAGVGACPVCGEPRVHDARFCEVCRYDFVARTGGPPPAPRPTVAAAPSSAPAPSSEAARWELVVTIDPSLDTDPDPAVAPPREPERVFAVEVAEMLVGRRDDSQNVRPAIPLHDPGASRRHAKFLLGKNGRVSLHDLASTNGTQHNGKDVVSGAVVPLEDGDQVTIGRWTRIRLRARA